MSSVSESNASATVDDTDSSDIIPEDTRKIKKLNSVVGSHPQFVAKLVVDWLESIGHVPDGLEED